ncbi:MAG TPA: FMN-binding negative transcriptional regulator [Polyangiaceae bacterium]|nr:FMN-binding negative transcriptional regulator [Polyangiaceae bacterium]
MNAPEKLLTFLRRHVIDQGMHIPSAFRVVDRGVLERFMGEHGFAAIVSQTDNGLLATHVPLLLEQEGDDCRLLGHMARANPHWRYFDDRQEAMVIFQGPHGYVSPSWYATAPAVPTWNYAVAHVYGRPRVIEDRSRLRALLEQLVARYESSMPAPWSAARLPPEYLEHMTDAIVAFSISVDRIEGKFKLGQNRSREDREGVIAGLTNEGGNDGLALATLARQLLRT